MCLRAGEPALTLAECVRNLGDEPAPFTWGHHFVLGAPFLEEGCRLEMPAGVIISPDVQFEPATAALAPGQREAWPLALGRQPGQRVDLRQIRGPEAHIHDDVFLGELAHGHFTVTNARLGLAVSLDWDAEVFRYVVLWMPYGGSDAAAADGHVRSGRGAVGGTLQPGAGRSPQVKRAFWRPASRWKRRCASPTLLREVDDGGSGRGEACTARDAQGCGATGWDVRCDGVTACWPSGSGGRRDAAADRGRRGDADYQPNLQARALRRQSSLADWVGDAEFAQRRLHRPGRRGRPDPGGARLPSAALPDGR